jgi:hypothetical protein
MKAYLLPLIGLVLGALLAAYVFGMLFTGQVAELLPKGLLPLGAAAMVSFALTSADPGRWKTLAVAVALPTVLMVVLALIGLGMEGRYGDWTWSLIAGAAICVCVIPSWLAQAYWQNGD